MMNLRHIDMRFRFDDNDAFIRIADAEDAAEIDTSDQDDNCVGIDEGCTCGLCTDFLESIG